MAALDAKRRWAGPGSGPPSGPPVKRRMPDSQEEEGRVDSYELEAEDVDQRFVEEDLEIEMGEAGQNWERPAAPPLDCENERICESQDSGCSSSLHLQHKGPTN